MRLHISHQRYLMGHGYIHSMVAISRYFHMRCICKRASILDEQILPGLARVWAARGGEEPVLVHVGILYVDE